MPSQPQIFSKQLKSINFLGQILGGPPLAQEDVISSAAGTLENALIINTEIAKLKISTLDMEWTNHLLCCGL